MKIIMIAISAFRGQHPVLIILCPGSEVGLFKSSGLSHVSYVLEDKKPVCYLQDCGKKES
jgi:hypothetical protein